MMPFNEAAVMMGELPLACMHTSMHAYSSPDQRAVQIIMQLGGHGSQHDHKEKGKCCWAHLQGPKHMIGWLHMIAVCSWGGRV